jgi:hypothetical protein
MKNLSTYENWLITERNRTVQYFREHPEELSKFADGIQPHHKQDFNAQQAISGYNDPQWEVREKILKVAKIKLMKMGSETGGFEIGRAQWTWTNLLIAEAPDGWSGGWYDLRYFQEALIKSRTFDDFLAEVDSKARHWKYPFEDYGKKVEPNEEPLLSLYKWMRNHFEELQDFCKWLLKALSSIENLGAKQTEKEFMKLGLSINDVKVAMTYVKEWTSMSRKKLDPSVWPLLQKISVDSSLLPQYIYRGIFYDGSKIKDVEKWKKSWYPGAKPGASQGKATSWTIDRGTAISFMTDQDFIKDKSNGYYMLLKWRVDPKLVIADLRNLPVDHSYWNQQEIIVSPEARDYEIDTMVPGSEGDEAYKEFARSNKGGQGAWGKTKADYALDFMNTPYDTLSPSMRMEFKQIAKMTLGEFRREFPNTRITADRQWDEIAMPLYNYFTRYLSNVTTISVKRNEIKFVVRYSLRDLDYSGDPNVRSIYKKYYDEMKFNQFAGVLEIVSNEGSIVMMDDDFYNMDLEVNLPTEFKIMNYEDKSSDRGLDVQADEALEKIFNELGSDVFVNLFKSKNQENLNRLPKNINIEIR